MGVALKTHAGSVHVAGMGMVTLAPSQGTDDYHHGAVEGVRR